MTVDSCAHRPETSYNYNQLKLLLLVTKKKPEMLSRSSVNDPQMLALARAAFNHFLGSLAVSTWVAISDCMERLQLTEQRHVERVGEMAFELISTALISSAPLSVDNDISEAANP